MTTEQAEFWQRVAGYEQDYSREDFHGEAVATALQLRREAEDILADLSDWAACAGDTDDEQDYVRWLQHAGQDIASRIDVCLGAATSPEEAEQHMSFAYAVLREVARDALTRKPEDQTTGSTSQSRRPL
jgi:hypothetical protein